MTGPPSMIPRSHNLITSPTNLSSATATIPSSSSQSLDTTSTLATVTSPYSSLQPFHTSAQWPVFSLSHTRCWYMVSLCREVVVGVVEVSRVRTPWITIERSWRQQLGSDKREQMELFRSGEREVMLVWICSQTEPMLGGPALLRK